MSSRQADRCRAAPQAFGQRIGSRVTANHLRSRDREHHGGCRPIGGLVLRLVVLIAGHDHPWARAGGSAPGSVKAGNDDERVADPLSLRQQAPMLDVRRPALGSVVKAGRNTSDRFTQIVCQGWGGIGPHRLLRWSVAMMRGATRDFCRRWRLLRVSRGPLRSAAIGSGRVRARAESLQGNSARSLVAAQRQKGTGEPAHDADTGRARASAASRSHQPSQSFRPGRRRQRFSRPLHFA